LISHFPCRLSCPKMARWHGSLIVVERIRNVACLFAIEALMSRLIFILNPLCTFEIKPKAP
jgi:hypothetical protein